MASPFPGMDPFLEAGEHWPAFQQQLIGYLCSALQPSLADRYRLRTGTRIYVHEQALFVSVIREEHREEYLEIRQRSSGKITTLIEVISPGNRTTAAGRQEYVARRNEARHAGANFVELELVLQGQTCLDRLPANMSEWDYLISVSRAHPPDRREIYASTLREHLPRFRLPLAADDRDLEINLQTVVTRIYDQFFAGQVDYHRDPPASLRDADRQWADTLLKQQKLR